MVVGGEETKKIEACCWSSYFSPFHSDATSSTTPTTDRPTSNQQAASRKGDKIVHGIKEHGTYFSMLDWNNSS